MNAIPATIGWRIEMTAKKSSQSSRAQDSQGGSLIDRGSTTSSAVAVWRTAAPELGATLPQSHDGQGSAARRDCAGKRRSASRDWQRGGTDVLPVARPYARHIVTRSRADRDAEQLMLTRRFSRRPAAASFDPARAGTLPIPLKVEGATQEVSHRVLKETRS